MAFSGQGAGKVEGLFVEECEAITQILDKEGGVAILGHRAGLGKTELARHIQGLDSPVIWARYGAVLALELCRLAMAHGLVDPLEMDHQVALKSLRKALVEGDLKLPGGGLIFDDCQDPDLILPLLIPGVKVVVTSARSVFSGVVREISLKPLQSEKAAEFLASRLGSGVSKEDCLLLAEASSGVVISLELAVALLSEGSQSPSDLMSALAHLGEEAEEASSEGAAPSGDLAEWVQQSMRRAMALGNQGLGPEQPEPSTQVLFGILLRSLTQSERWYYARRAFSSPFSELNGLGLEGGDTSALGQTVLRNGVFHGAYKGAILGYLSSEELEEALRDACKTWLLAWNEGTDEAICGAFVLRRDGLISHLLEMAERVSSRGLCCDALYILENEGAKWLKKRGLLMEGQSLLEQSLLRMNRQGEGHAQRWSMHQTLSGIFVGLGQQNEARYQLEEAVRRLEANFGCDHHQISKINEQRETLLKFQFRSVLDGNFHLP